MILPLHLALLNTCLQEAKSTRQWYAYFATCCCGNSQQLFCCVLWSKATFSNAVRGYKGHVGRSSCEYIQAGDLDFSPPFQMMKMKTQENISHSQSCWLHGLKLQDLGLNVKVLVCITSPHMDPCSSCELGYSQLIAVFSHSSVESSGGEKN